MIDPVTGLDEQLHVFSITKCLLVGLDQADRILSLQVAMKVEEKSKNIGPE